MDDRSLVHDQLKAQPVEGSLDTPVVVIGVDGSATSWDAFSWGCGEALRLGARTVAVFVTSGAETSAVAVAAAMPGVMVDYAEIERTDDERATELGVEVQKYASTRGWQATFVHARGDPGTMLARVASELHADLIVVGRSSKMRHRLVGSIGRGLINRNETPVVVVVP